MDWRGGAKFAGLCLGLAFVAGFVLFMAFTLGTKGSRSYAAAQEPIAALLVLLGAICLLLAWRRRLDPLGEALGLFGLFVFVLMGYMDAQPNAWEVLPAFLLPWALLVVELPNRHRLVLLVAQWLASAMLLEVWTGEAATTVLFGLALAHAAAVWATLPEGPLRRAPVAVGALVVATTLGAALWFTVQEPTMRRFVFLAACVAVLAGFAFLVRSGRLRALRVPTLVRAT